MNKVYNSQQLNKKSGACQKLTELTGFTHMKHILITDTKTAVSGLLEVHSCLMISLLLPW